MDSATTQTVFLPWLLYCSNWLGYFYIYLDDDLADWQLVEDIRVSVTIKFSVLYINYTHTLLNASVFSIVYPVSC